MKSYVRDWLAGVRDEAESHGGVELGDMHYGGKHIRLPITVNGTRLSLTASLSPNGKLKNIGYKRGAADLRKALRRQGSTV